MEKTIKIDRIFIKDAVGPKGPFKSYRVKEAGSDTWYGLKGWGKADVKEGDEVTGELSSREWEGKEYYDITLAKKEVDLSAIYQRLDDLDKRISNLETNETKDEVSVDDIPF